MITVLNSGMFTTVQDLGRKDYQAYGIPLAGAMDAYAAKVANIMAGNDENEALLEFTITGGSYRFDSDMLIALTGADMNATCEGHPLKNWATHKIKKGDVVTFAFVSKGCRSYMAVAGGLDIPLVMDSASTHTRSKLGGFDGRALKKEDVLMVKESAYDRETVLPEAYLPVYESTPVIRVMPGPQDDYFTGNAFFALTEGDYMLEADSDRMGYRLSGNAIKHKDTADIISDALFRGAVQVPGNGQPIIMLSDCQTTGGYTKLCFVISADLDVLAQCKPGDKIKFAVVSEDEAVTALKEQREKIAQVKAFVTSNDIYVSKQYVVKINGINYNVYVEG